MDGTATIYKNNKAVVITKQGKTVWAVLYVNARDGIQNATITPTRRNFGTVLNARRWAKKILDQ